MAAAAAAAASNRTLRLLSLRGHHLGHRTSSSYTETPEQLAIRAAIETNNHCQIPRMLSSSSAASDPSPAANPFSYLSHLPPNLTARIVDDMLQSSLPLRPRSLPHPTFAALLSLFLPQTDTLPVGYPSVNLPLALAVLQTGIRSGYSPPTSTCCSLSLSWVRLRRCHPRLPASRVLSSVRTFGYRPDVRTCNYLISSLCSASEVEEAIAVLRGMCNAGCGPDAESYCTVIEACCVWGGKGPSSTLGVRTAVELLREMTVREGVIPRKGTVGVLVAAMRREGRGREAADMVRFLAREGCGVGFEEYQSALEGCLKGGEFVMAGKMVVEMAERGFIPYIKARHKVVEGLARIGQQELASAVRQSLAKIKS